MYHSICKWYHWTRIVLPQTHFVWLSRNCDVDFAGSKADRKSTSGTYHFLSNSLVSWSSKKQFCVALSTTKAEYITAGLCCAQILWEKQNLVNFGLHFYNTRILCDNTSAINISKNSALHSRTRHIDVRHHFLRDQVEKQDVSLIYVDTRH